VATANKSTSVNEEGHPNRINECMIQQSNSATLMWQQFLAILQTKFVFWIRSWKSLLFMLIMITVAFCGIFFMNTIKNEAPTKLSMEKLLDPQVLLVAGTSRDSSEMKRLIGLFRENVERDHGTFIEEEQNQALNDSKRESL
jgi:uncharacterized SAM-binding protein YcdF (DUF218 family)